MLLIRQPDRSPFVSLFGKIILRHNIIFFNKEGGYMSTKSLVKTGEMFPTVFEDFF